MKSRFPLACFCLMVPLSLVSYGAGQTFDVNGGGSAPDAQSGQSSSGDNNFSWGSGIEVARQARAADEALKRNDFASAVAHAQQAVNAAPQDGELWFLLGYTARLNGQYPLSVDAYNKGLRHKPNSVRGLAGLAQTYAKMGRDKEAQQLLQKVIAANPQDADSLELAGELLLTSDPKSALPLLQRADAVKPSAHGDLLIARAYERLGQPDEVTRYVNQAKSRGPHDPDVLRAVAEQYRNQGKFDDAIASLQAIPNKSADTLAELAYTYELAGNAQEAASIYSRVAKAAKSNIGLQLSAAQASIAAGRPEDATPFLDTARQIDPNYYRLHAILGSLAQSDDRIADAVQEYKTALNNLPPQVQEGPLYPIELRLNLYEAYTQANDAAGAKQQLDAAAADIQRAQVPDSSRPELLRLRAAVESASGNVNAANRDLNEALSLAPTNIDSLLNLANLQWKMDQKDAARDTYKKVLNIDKNNKQALEGLGYLARDVGDAKLAETYFTRAATAHPKDYAPFLALGDLYTAQRNFRAAQKNYEDAYQRMPSNPLIVAGGADAAIESHNLDLAQHWLQRADAKINTNTRVKLERERYLTFKGQYEESAKLGYDVIGKLPNDREAVDYLAYDLYYLHRYDEALSLVNKYRSALPKDKDLPLIAGNVEVHNGDLRAALKDFTTALDLDPQIANGYTSRGFVLNDLKQPTRAYKDFESALKLQPDYGEAHLGLAFSDLQLHRPKQALRQLQIAQKSLGKSRTWHLASAEAYRQELDYTHAAAEYRTALDEDPKDVKTQLAYADVLYQMRHYQEAIASLDNAAKITPSEPEIYALRAQLHAKLNDRNATLHD
ncbi:MAG TPA: tetratricopeptide repeat protein, partial [Dongiaceae bacterium]|nr:tetratricopeptide repeat protein [Dongiaceae bacterium]